VPIEHPGLRATLEVYQMFKEDEPYWILVGYWHGEKRM